MCLYCWRGHPSSNWTSKEPNSFVKLCREHSDCASAEQPGTLAGHMGWVARGEQEPAMEEAAFALGLNEFGDLVALFVITKVYRMEKYSGEQDGRNIWIHNVFTTAS
eukprot:s5442_g2.t1